MQSRAYLTENAGKLIADIWSASPAADCDCGLTWDLGEGEEAADDADVDRCGVVARDGAGDPGFTDVGIEVDGGAVCLAHIGFDVDFARGGGFVEAKFAAAEAVVVEVAAEPVDRGLWLEVGVLVGGKDEAFRGCLERPEGDISERGSNSWREIRRGFGIEYVLRHGVLPITTRFVCLRRKGMRFSGAAG